MRVTFHGVRGSTPCHGDDTLRYGGNTSCVSLDAPGQQPVVFDLGTGLRYFGAAWPADRTFVGSCLLSHLHWDHTQGLPFFTPLLRPGAELDLYAPAQDDGCSVGDVLRQAVRPPLFPISIDQFPGTVRCHDVGDEEFDLGDFHVMARLIPHVGPTLGYRVELDGRSVAYLSDHQQPYDGSLAVSDGAMELCRGVDVLIHDAQYLADEFAAKATWGHCTIDYAVWLAAEAGVGRLVLFHHDPTRTDDAVDDVLRCASAAGQRLGVEVLAAREGLVVEV